MTRSAHPVVLATLLVAFGVHTPSLAAPPEVEALIKNLGDRDESVRLKAAKELGKLKEKAKDAVPALKVAAADPDEDVRAVAQKALVQILGAANPADTPGPKVPPAPANPANDIAAAEKAFQDATDRHRAALLKAVDAAVDAAAANGDTKLTTRLRAERKAFEADPLALPSAPAVAAARGGYEVDVDAARAEYVGRWRAAVAALTRARQFDAAEAEQAKLDAFAKQPVVPRDVSAALCGTWQWALNGRTDRGPFVLSVTCTFKADGTALCHETKTAGAWAYSPKLKQVRVDWANGSWETLPVPLNPSGTRGTTAVGPNVRVTATKK